MINFIIILLKFNIAIMALWLFYVLLLERLTFFVPARFFFLSGILVSVFLSLMQFELFDSLFAQPSGGADLGQYIPSLQGFTNNSFSSIMIFLPVYGLGAFLLTGNLLIQYLSYRNLKKHARLTEMNGEKIYIAQKDILPFSFGNAVFVSEKIITHPEIGKILSHEFIHIRQKHSIDIFMAELVRIIGWFNPFAWLLKKAISRNLEFLTDAELINKGLDKKSYQYLLLHFSGNRAFSLVTNFNFYSLKTRISKMNQNKSNQLQYARFLLFIPMVLVLMFVFSCMNDQMTDEAPRPEKMDDAKLKLSLKELVIKPDANNQDGFQAIADVKFTKLKLSTKEPETMPDATNGNLFKAVEDISILESKSKLREKTLTLSIPPEDNSKQSLLLQKIKKSSREVVEQTPPPPPPAMPDKQ